MKKQILVLFPLLLFILSFPVVSQETGKTNFKINIKGKLLLSSNINDPATFTTINIITEQKAKLQSSKTDAFGNFKFSNLDPEKNYILIIDSKEIKNAPDSLFLADKNGSIRKKSDFIEESCLFSIKTTEQKFFAERIYPDPLSQIAESINNFFATTKSVKVTGYLKDENNNSISRVKVTLITPEGKRLYTTFTDTSGYFLFKNLPGHKKYQVRYDTKKNKNTPGSNVYLKDHAGDIILTTQVEEHGFYSFHNLPVVKIETAQTDIELVTLAGSVLTGNETLKPLNEQTLHLINEKGEIVRITETDSTGFFKFTHLPADQKFLITIPETDSKIKPNTKVVITDKRGKTIYTTVADFKGSFTYEALAMENSKLKLMSEDSDTELKIQVRGKIMEGEKGNLPLKNAQVKLFNEKGELIQTSKTDMNGDFKFTNLPPDQIYLVTVDEVSTNLNQKYLFLADSNGKVIKRLVFDNGVYKFEILPSDHHAIATIYSEDPWLKIKDIKSKQKESILIIENIYYDYGKAAILPDASKILDKVVGILKENSELKIEILSYTDSRGNKSFNLDLSQKRAKAAVSYIISKGIDSNRVNGKGLGDSLLMNYCTSEVECPEELHRQNRRTEFKVFM
ncbi:MAG: OmpA family protein [Bacteroidota bacterium]|nr:OmpA family protein [Bacteroidota bacterium]